MEVPEAPLVDQEEVVDQQGATPAVLEVEVSLMDIPEDQEEAADQVEAEDLPVVHPHLPSDLDDHCTNRRRPGESLTEFTVIVCPLFRVSGHGSWPSGTKYPALV